MSTNKKLSLKSHFQDFEFSFLTNSILWLGIILSCASVIIDVFARFIFFDERAHLQFLWLLGIGLTPHADYWCHYPPWGYYLYLPVIQNFLNNANVLVILRVLSAIQYIFAISCICLFCRKIYKNWWMPLIPAVLLALNYDSGRILVEFRTDGVATLLAVISIGLLLSRERGWLQFAAVVLSLFSIFIMPKYAFTLFFAHAFSVFGRISDRNDFWNGVKVGLLGICAAFLALFAVSLACEINLRESFRWTFILMDQQMKHLATTGGIPPPAPGFLPYLQINWPLTLICSAALLGFFLQFQKLKRMGEFRWILLGMLVGLFYTQYRNLLPFPQYFPPFFIPLFFCVPLILPIDFGLSKYKIPLIYSVIFLFVSATFFTTALQRVANSSLFADITVEQNLLNIIPQDERVLSLFTPAMRRPLTFLSCDCGSGIPPTFQSMVNDSPEVASEFTAEGLKSYLSKRKPALIHILHTRNIPPSWPEVISEFAASNSAEYELVNLRGVDGLIRKDLINKK